MRATWPSGTIASRRYFAPPVSASVGAPEGAFTTPTSFMNTPALKPVPTAFENASLAAKRLASVPALVNGRFAARALGIGEDAGFEAIPEPVERLLNPLDIAQVGAEADDHNPIPPRAARGEK